MFAKGFSGFEKIVHLAQVDGEFSNLAFIKLIQITQIKSTNTLVNYKNVAKLLRISKFNIYVICACFLEYNFFLGYICIFCALTYSSGVKNQKWS
jgi:hypothetical protein